ncbi:MAG: hypothetical protein ACK56W_20695 [Pirellula sp.]|nr:hypothetical protein [Pirellula sp.]
MLTLSLGCLASIADDRLQVESATKPTKQSYFWIFLTSGKSTANVDRGEIEKMQASHLGNFGRMESSFVIRFVLGCVAWIALSQVHCAEELSLDKGTAMEFRAARGR